MMTNIKHYSKCQPTRRSGFTLLEAMISAVLVVIIGLTIITLMIQIFKTQQFERERVVALNRASQRVEELKRQLYPALRGSLTNITLDVQNTPDTATDDLTGQMVVKIRDRAGAIITGAPMGNDSIQVEVTVKWSSQGRFHTQSIYTIMSP